MKEFCSRCGNRINLSRWEEQWPNYGKVQLGFASQIFGTLCGEDGCAKREHFKVWHEGHPAMTLNGAQQICFEWRKGGENDYILCRECQREFIGIVGAFFRFPERAEEIRRTL